jgi:hypothetical protein
MRSEFTWPAVIVVLLIAAISGLLYFTTRTTPGAEGVDGSGGGGEVKTVTLKDGTQCAVLIGYQKGSISCGWKSSK